MKILMFLCFLFCVIPLASQEISTASEKIFEGLELLEKRVFAGSFAAFTEAREIALRSEDTESFAFASNQIAYLLSRNNNHGLAGLLLENVPEENSFAEIPLNYAISKYLLGNSNIPLKVLVRNYLNDKPAFIIDSKELEDIIQFSLLLFPHDSNDNKDLIERLITHLTMAHTYSPGGDSDWSISRFYGEKGEFEKSAQYFLNLLNSNHSHLKKCLSFPFMREVIALKKVNEALEAQQKERVVFQEDFESFDPEVAHGYQGSYSYYNPEAERACNGILSKLGTEGRYLKGHEIPENKYFHTEVAIHGMHPEHTPLYSYESKLFLEFQYKFNGKAFIKIQSYFPVERANFFYDINNPKQGEWVSASIPIDDFQSSSPNITKPKRGSPALNLRFFVGRKDSSVEFFGIDNVRIVSRPLHKKTQTDNFKTVNLSFQGKVASLQSNGTISTYKDMPVIQSVNLDDDKWFSSCLRLDFWQEDIHLAANSEITLTLAVEGDSKFTCMLYSQDQKNNFSEIVYNSRTDSTGNAEFFTVKLSPLTMVCFGDRNLSLKPGNKVNHIQLMAGKPGSAAKIYLKAFSVNCKGK